jgi:hypothetical protein
MHGSKNIKFITSNCVCHVRISAKPQSVVIYSRPRHISVTVFIKSRQFSLTTFQFIICKSRQLSLTHFRFIICKSRQLSLTPFQFIIYKSRKLSLISFHFIINKSSHSVFTKPGKRKMGVNRSTLMVCVLFNDTSCVWNYRPFRLMTHKPSPQTSSRSLFTRLASWKLKFKILQFECIQTCFVTVVLAVTL